MLASVQKTHTLPSAAMTTPVATTSSSGRMSEMLAAALRGERTFSRSNLR